jgi:hypothetical protein
LILNSGEPWAVGVAFGGGISFTVGLVLGLRWLNHTVRRRLRGAWRESYGRLRRFQQDIGLLYWLRAATLLAALSAPFLTAPAPQSGVGGVLLVLLALQIGPQNSFFMALLAAPTAMALYAWAHVHDFGWRDRVLMMFVVGLALCVAVFTAADQMVKGRRWQPRLRRVFLGVIGLLMIYAPLLIWKDLRR